ncbi:hypothetical protein [Lysobacter sp. TY2-98]|uniref:hypothetical protein n=1 Tax=Lysobacter sp. TY2-98 TaxID=2290922 RepID=UPI0013B37170|nr:hypothetical protein [Lysobacter sp. TY2-98]
MLERLFPRVADNHYPGQRVGLWLLWIMLLKIPMGVNVMLNAPQVARTADGVPLDTFGSAGAAAFLFAFAAWGLCQLVLGLLCLIVLLRYRSLASLAFLALLVEQFGRMALRSYWPIERIAAPGAAINMALAGIMLVGFLLSLWRPRSGSAGA